MLQSQVLEHKFSWVDFFCCHWQYSEIWALDEKDPFLPPEGGESVADVASRLTKALVDMESEFNE